jgi:hypothetical protein
MSHHSSLLLALLLTVGGLAATGCGARRQAASDAVAGIQVLRTEQPAAVREPVADAAQHLAAAAAGTTVDRLPPPTIPAAQIPDRVPEYQATAQAAADSTGWWLTVGGWALSGLIAVAGILRTTGLGGPVVTLAAGLLESAGQRFKRKETELLAGAAVNIIGAVENKGLTDVKSLVKDVVTDEQNLAVLRTVASWTAPAEKPL